VLERRVTGQEIGETVFVAHPEIGADLRPLQVEIDQEYPGVRVLCERERKVDGRQGLALAGARAGHPEGEPAVGHHAVQHPGAQDLVRPRDRQVLDPQQHPLALQALRIERRHLILLPRSVAGGTRDRARRAQRGQHPARVRRRAGGRDVLVRLPAHHFLD
jgi:hypothetical protein